MEEEFGKEYFLAPSISDKKNLMNHVVINGRLDDKDSKTRGTQVIQLGVDSNAVTYGTQGSNLNFEAIGFVSAKINSRESDIVNTPAEQQRK